MTRICLGLIQAYRICISPFMGPACRFYPSCSLYAHDAIQKHGLLKGTAMACWRLLKCHPFHPGGLDPVK